MQDVAPQASVPFAHSALMRRFEKNIWLACLSPYSSSEEKILSERTSTASWVLGRPALTQWSPCLHPVPRLGLQLPFALTTKPTLSTSPKEKADTLSSTSHSFAFQSAQSLDGETALFTGLLEIKRPTKTIFPGRTEGQRVLLSLSPAPRSCAVS